MTYFLPGQLSLAQEEQLKIISVPLRVSCSQIEESEREKTERFQCYVVAAGEYGPKLKKESSFVTALDTQIQSYRRQLKKMKRKLQKVRRLSSDGPLSLVFDASSPLSNTSPQSLGLKQLEEIRGKFLYDYKYAQNTKHIFRPITPRNGPSLLRDVESKRRKLQTLSVKKSALKQEIVALARSLEKTTVIKNFPAIKLDAIPHHVSEAVSSERRKRLGVVKAHIR
jgi:ribosome-associated translation inhibitor RaiA